MNYHFPLFGCFLIFIVWLTYEMKKSGRQQIEKDTLFWEKESAANATRRVPIEKIPFLTIPLDTFPLHKYEDEKLREYEQTLLTLSTKKILNVTGKTATDLKEQYGPANLSLLDECDTNFTELAQTLVNYGTRLHELNHDDESILVLEYGIDILTDISANYKLLAELYLKEHQPEKISELEAAALQLDSLMKNSILKYLSEIRTSYSANSDQNEK